MSIMVLARSVCQNLVHLRSTFDCFFDLIESVIDACVDSGFKPTALVGFVICVSVRRDPDDHVQARISLFDASSENLSTAKALLYLLPRQVACE